VTTLSVASVSPAAGSFAPQFEQNLDAAGFSN
jgi:hypothetical protein